MLGPLGTVAYTHDGAERAARIQDAEAFLRLGETCPQETSGWVSGTNFATGLSRRPEAAAVHRPIVESSTSSKNTRRRTDPGHCQRRASLSALRPIATSCAQPPLSHLSDCATREYWRGSRRRPVTLGATLRASAGARTTRRLPAPNVPCETAARQSRGMLTKSPGQDRQPSSARARRQ